MNEAEYCESNTATGSYAQGDLTRNPEAVTHASNKDLRKTYLGPRHFMSCSP